MIILPVYTIFFEASSKKPARHKQCPKRNHPDIHTVPGFFFCRYKKGQTGEFQSAMDERGEGRALETFTEDVALASDPDNSHALWRPFHFR